MDDIEVSGGHGVIVSRLDPSWVLADSRRGKLVVQRKRDECPHQTWEVVSARAEDHAKPATSCHLAYKLPEQVTTDCALVKV